MTKYSLSLITFCLLVSAPPAALAQSQDLSEDIQEIIPDPVTRQGWSDSYSVNGQCYCDTTYDHDIGNLNVSTPIGTLSVQQVCEHIDDRLGEGPLEGRIYYNTIQCGYGPTNDDPTNDEIICPGIPKAKRDYTGYRCHEKGATWNLDVLYDAIYNDGTGDTNSDDTDDAVDTDVKSEPSILYRVNAGGGALGDNWISDSEAKQYVNAGNIWGKPQSINRNGIDNSVPTAIFQSERWHHGAQSPMHWAFPVTPGQYRVNLYFSEIWSGAMKNGGRVFDAVVENNTISNIDVYSEVGGFAALQKTINVTADNTLDIKFIGKKQNPSVKGIEIIALNSDSDDTDIIDDDASDNSDTNDVIADDDTANRGASDDDTSNNDASDDDASTNDASDDDASTNDASDDDASNNDSSDDDASTNDASDDDASNNDASDDDASNNDASDDDTSNNDASDDDTSNNDVSDDNGTDTSYETLYLINAGGDTVINGNDVWVSDKAARQYAATGHAWSSNQSISRNNIRADVPTEIFQSERWSNTHNSALHWKFPVEPGLHEVTLYFAEIWSGGLKTGARVFDVAVEGSGKNRIDVFAEAGGFTAIEKVFTVETDSELDIIFTKVKQNPAVKGIKIVALNAADSSQTDNTTNTQSSDQSNNTSSNQTDTSADNDLFTPLEPDKEAPQSCSVSGATLPLAKQAYAATCSLPRKDCDPGNGGWVCSSGNL